MKKICRIIAVNLIISLLSIFPGIALASSNGNPATVKAGTWYNLKDEYPAPVYRFKVADNAIVTINWKGNKNGEIRFAFHIDQNCEHEVYTTYYLHDEKGIEMFSLSKGTYYLLMENNGGVKTAKARVLVQKAPDQGNYKKSKAVSLGANKVAYIANTPDCCYTRWYKIKLNKKKSISVYTNEGHADRITIFNSKMNRVKCAIGDTKVTSERGLDAGMYYIRVVAFSPFYSAYLLDDEYASDCMTIKWN